MRQHIILRVVFLLMVLLNPKANSKRMEEETGDPCDNIDTMDNDDECFRSRTTEATMGVGKYHLCVHRCFSKYSMDKGTRQKNKK